MYALSCARNASGGLMTLYTSAGTQLFSSSVYDWNNFNYVKYDTLAPGIYRLAVTPKWNTDDVKDYTVRVYGPSIVSIVTGKVKSLSNPIIGNFTSYDLDGINAAIGSHSNITVFNHFNSTD